MHGQGKFEWDDGEYYEGGMQLLLAQRPDGSFQSGHPSTLALDSTCFALLFLSKASKQGPVTGG